MARCGCSAGQCSWALSSTQSVEVRGFGTASEPFSLNLLPSMQVEDSASLALDLTQIGLGQLQLSALPTAPSLAQVFTADGTWENPGDISSLRLMIVGGGGGGGGGGTWVAGMGSAYMEGGGGGASGAITNLTLIGTQIPAGTVNVTVGAGGAGGIAGSPNGTSGGDGEASLFGDFLALGGGGGSPGAGGNGGAASTTGGTVPGDPGRSSPYALPGGWDVGVSRLAPGGGGAGAAARGSETGPTLLSGDLNAGWSAPGSGYLPGRVSPYKATVPVSPASLPGHGVNNLVTLTGSGGAGGLRGVAGGNGGLYGGGGGGGGAGSAGSEAFPASNGGNGGAGVVIVIGW